jgi:hypothetical protein
MLRLSDPVANSCNNTDLQVRGQDLNHYIYMRSILQIKLGRRNQASHKQMGRLIERAPFRIHPFADVDLRGATPYVNMPRSGREAKLPIEHMTFYRSRHLTVVP